MSVAAFPTDPLRIIQELLRVYQPQLLQQFDQIRVAVHVPDGIPLNRYRAALPSGPVRDDKCGFHDPRVRLPRSPRPPVSAVRVTHAKSTRLFPNVA